MASKPDYVALPAQVQGAARETPRALAGLTLKSVETLGAQSAAGLPARAGVIVLAVEAGSQGAAALLRPHNVIVGVGTQTVADGATLVRLLELQRDTTLLLMRAGFHRLALAQWAPLRLMFLHKDCPCLLNFIGLVSDFQNCRLRLHLAQWPHSARPLTITNMTAQRRQETLL